MTKNMLRTAALAASVCSILPVAAQWTSFTSTNSPFTQNQQAIHVATDASTGSIYAVARDTAYHLFSHQASAQWNTHPAFDALLDTVNAVYDTKARNGQFWALTDKGLVWWQPGAHGIVAFPAGYAAGTNGLVVLNDSSIWFTGGVQGHGITSYKAGRGWFSVDGQTHPAFLQDIGITDLKMQEADSVLWIGTNCFTQSSGVYSYHLRNNELIRHPNVDPKYGCVHAVEPAAGKIVVGTANFSSLRILEPGGTYTQNVDAPRVPWVTEMRVDPTDSNRVWVLTDNSLLLFTDSNSLEVFDTTGAPFRGSMNELAVMPLAGDSAALWVGTTSGLYRYLYAGHTPVGVAEPGLDATLSIYPNPAIETLTVQSSSHAITRVTLADVTGKVVLQLETGSTNLVQVQTAHLPAGMYVATIYAGPEFSVRKLVLAR